MDHYSEWLTASYTDPVSSDPLQLNLIAAALQVVGGGGGGGYSAGLEVFTPAGPGSNSEH